MEEIKNGNKSVYNGQPAQNDADAQFSISDIFAIFVQKKWWMVAGVVVALLFAFVHLYRTPSVYVRSANLIVDESQQEAAVRNLSSFTGGGMRLRNTVAVENEMEGFTSPDLMTKVVERNNFQTRYVEKQFLRKVELYVNTPFEMVLAGDNPRSSFSFRVQRESDSTFVLDKFTVGSDRISGTVKGALNDTLSTPAGRMLIAPTMNLDRWKNEITVSWVNPMAMAKAMGGRLSANLSSKESTVLVLSYEDNFPVRAETVLSTLIDVYNEVWLYDKNRASRNTNSFIVERLAVIENELGGIEGDLQNFKSKNNLTDVRAAAQKYLEESSVYAEKIFAVNNQLSIAGFIRDYLNDPTHQADLIPSNLGISGNNVEGQISEYNRLILQRDRYLNAGSENPIVADVNAAIQSLRAAILRSIDNLVTTLTFEAERLKEQEDQILRRISSSSTQEYELLSMQRQQKVKESLYVFLLQKREENEITSLVNVGNTRVIMRPNGSSSPVSPKRMQMLLLAVILGIGIPFAYFFLRVFLDTTVKTRGDLVRLNIPFLAEIPYSEVVKKRLFSKKPKMEERQSRILVKAGKRDMMNEAYRVLRTNLDLMIGRQANKVIMLTSFNPNAGKTYNCINIAASMAIKPAKVIVLDLDMRKGSLGKSLDIDAPVGISSYLNGDINDIGSIKVEIQKNLDCVPVGVLPPNPTELLLSDRLPALLEELKKEYDYIFLDCPPIEIVADPAIITQYADITLFVARAGLLDKRVLPSINELYEQQRYTRMCMLLNGVQMIYKPYAKSGSGYGYGYG